MSELNHAVDNTSVPLLLPERVTLAQAQHLVSKKVLRTPVAKLLTALLLAAMHFRAAEASPGKVRADAAWMQECHCANGTEIPHAYCECSVTTTDSCDYRERLTNTAYECDNTSTAVELAMRLNWRKSQTVGEVSGMHQSGSRQGCHFSPWEICKKHCWRLYCCCQILTCEVHACQEDCLFVCLSL